MAEEDIDLDSIERRMKGAVDMLSSEFGGLRTGRASASLLDPITVDVYGSAMPINQVGTVSVPESRMLSVQVWDKGMVSAVSKAIREAGLGLNPMADGTLVRIPLPELNQERRKELTKIANKYAEQARVAVRNVRRDGMEALKKAEKDGHISQDEHRKLGEDIQKMTDKRVKTVDDTLAQKDTEIMTV